MVDQSPPPPPLPELSLVSVRPGQRLVLTVPEKVSAYAQDNFKKRISEWWGDRPPPRLLIVDGGCKLQALTEEPAGHVTVPAMREALNRSHDRNVRLSAALIALVEHFERVDACAEDKAAIQAACDVWAGVKCEAVTDLSPDLTRLVVAAREATYNASPEATSALDRAVEAFADRVPWDDAPEDTTPALAALKSETK